MAQPITGIVASGGLALGRIEPPPPAVLEGVRQRDRAALSTFFDRYFDLVHGVAYRMTGDRTAAEDLTQDVFYKVQLAAHSLDPTRDPAPWLVSITRNALYDQRRSARDRLDRASTSLDADPLLRNKLTGSAPSPEEARTQHERETRVQAAVARLPESLREVVVLHAFLGWGHDRIADVIGATHAATRKRYSRALAALADMLEDLDR